MPLPKTYIINQGFSLIEVVLSLGIFSIIASAGIVATITSLDRYEFNKEKQLILSTLAKARTEAMDNVLQSLQAVTLVSENPTVQVIVGSPIHFESLSGNALSSGTVTLNQGNHSETITIDQNGRINW